MKFHPLSDTERQGLLTALRDNAAHDRPIRMDPRDTTFLGGAEDVTDDEVIAAIRSVPCHYEPGQVTSRIPALA